MPDRLLNTERSFHNTAVPLFANKNKKKKIMLVVAVVTDFPGVDFVITSVTIFRPEMMMYDGDNPARD